MRRLNALASADCARERLKMRLAVIRNEMLARRSGAQQSFRDGHSIFSRGGERKPPITNVFKRLLTVDRSSFGRRRRTQFENTFDLRQVSTHSGGVNVSFHDAGMTLKDSRGVFPTRGMIVVGSIPLLSAGSNAVTKASVLQELRQLLVTILVSKGVFFERSFERGPVFYAVLTRERVLNIAKARLG